MANALAGQSLLASWKKTSTNRVRSARAVFARPSLRVRNIRLVAKAADDKSADLSGEWPVNWSLASYEDVGEFFKNSLFKEDAGNLLKDVMATSVKSVTPDTTLESIGNLFDSISGVPVTKSQSDKTLVGVMSKKDLKKASSYLALAGTCSTFLQPFQYIDMLLPRFRVERQLETLCQPLPLQQGQRTRLQTQLS